MRKPNDMFLTHAIRVAALVALLAGCTQSVDYYMAHEDEAKAVKENCDPNHRTENCDNAIQALEQLRKARAELRRAETIRAREKAREAAVKKYGSLSDEALFSATCTREPQDCVAYEEAKKAMVKRRINEMLDAHGWAVAIYDSPLNEDSLVPRYCRGLQMDKLLCVIAEGAERAASEAANSKLEEAKTHYLGNRSLIFDAFVECKRDLEGFLENLSEEQQEVHRFSVLSANQGVVPDALYAKCSGLRDALGELGVAPPGSMYVMSQSEFDSMVNGR